MLHQHGFFSFCNMHITSGLADRNLVYDSARPDRRVHRLLLVLEPGPVPQTQRTRQSVPIACGPLREVGLRDLQFKQGEPVYCLKGTSDT